MGCAMGKFITVGLILLGLCACSVEAPPDEDEIQLTLWTQDYWVGVTGHELDGVPLDDPRRAQYTVKDWYNKVARDFKAQYPDRRIRIDIETLD